EVGVRLQRLEQLHAAGAGHHDVEQDDVGLDLTRARKPRAAFLFGSDDPTRSFAHVAQKLQVGFVVVYRQNRCAHCRVLENAPPAAPRSTPAPSFDQACTSIPCGSSCGGRCSTRWRPWSYFYWSFSSAR